MHCLTYTIETDNISRNDWSHLLPMFSDSSLSQTWTPIRKSFPKSTLSHMILRTQEGVAALAQVSIKTIPFLNTGIATAYWAPIWRKKDNSQNAFFLDMMIQALKHEYVVDRGYLLRIWPTDFTQSMEPTKSLLIKHGFRKNLQATSYRTFILDLSKSLDQLWNNLAPNWRNKLRIAQRSSMTISSGIGDEMFETFFDLLKEMISRKRFHPTVDYKRYRQLQIALPEFLKMKLFVCSNNGLPISSIVVTAIGNTAVYLLGATGHNGLSLHASNLLHWEAIKYLKSTGYRWYDLGGIDAVRNYGVYSFKRGLAGKDATEIIHPGQYYIAPSRRHTILNALVNVIVSVRSTFRIVA